MINITNLTKIYTSNNKKFKALDNIDLTIDKGDIFGIIGLSGAGKSSLIRCINLLEKPTQGKILVDNTEISSLMGASLREARQKIGMIFQGFNLISSRTVFENISFPLEIIGTPKEKISKRVHELLELMELTDKKDVYPATLSGGQKQRVGIARALANNPNVLLCDEVTSALDPQSTKQILTLLKDLNRKLGVTLVVITHEMDVVKSICNRVAIMDKGQLSFVGNTIDLFGQSGKVPFINTPEVVIESTGNQKLLQLTFKGNSARKPILADLIRSLGVDVNILEGTIETIQNCSIGRLVIGVENSHEIIRQVKHFLESKEVCVEVLN